MTNETNPTPRIFVIGATRIVEDASLAGRSSEEIREILKLTYPEVAHATIRETEQDGQKTVSYLARPGRKG
ncbi:MAG: hypothetical protein GX573_27585 [Chloroflexi bacterium]|nr:hypothetical protein [Chloroflexota bacterium]